MLLQEFASLQGCSPQWARKLRARKDKAWMDFLAGHSVTGEPSPRIATRHQIDAAKSDLERARMSKQMTWDAYVRANELAEAAFRKPDRAVELPVLQRAAAQARKAWEEARDHCFKVEMEAGKYVPMASVVGMRNVVPMLAECIHSLRGNIAQSLPTQMRADFCAAFDEQRGNWNAAVKKLEEYLNNLLPSV